MSFTTPNNWNYEESAIIRGYTVSHDRDNKTLNSLLALGKITWFVVVGEWAYIFIFVFSPSISKMSYANTNGAANPFSV